MATPTLIDSQSQSQCLSISKPNVLDAIRMLSTAWDSVKKSTLKNCFRKAGWKKADVVQPDTEFVCSEADDEDIVLKTTFL